MGFLAESRAVSWLLGPLGQGLGHEKRAPAAVEDVGAPERAFDIADCMEKGLARELVSDFVQPLQDIRGLWRFDVERSRDRKEYRLYCSQGEFLMLAKVSKDSRHINFFLYDSQEGDAGLHDPQAPAFTMACDSSRTRWRLVQERYDCHCLPSGLGCGCQERSVLMDAAHSRQGVGSGVSHCLDVCLYRADGEARLASTLPVWNEEVRSMVLDFLGRQVVASAKNFQLAREGDPAERVVCQYAKTGPDRFGLDFKCPLTVIEAFGAALTTICWS